MSTVENTIKDLKVGNNEYIDKIRRLSNRVIVLYGLNGAGKDSIKDKLTENHNFIYNIKSTSRDIKSGEIKDITYHYIDKTSKEFNTIKNNAIVSYSYLGNYYWDDAKEVYENLINNPDKYIILIMGNIIGLKEFITVLPKTHKICILPAEDETEIIIESKSRMIDRDRDNESEILNRLDIISSSLAELQKVADKIIINKRNKLNEAVIDVINYLNETNSGFTT